MLLHGVGALRGVGALTGRQFNSSILSPALFAPFAGAGSDFVSQRARKRLVLARAVKGQPGKLAGLLDLACLAGREEDIRRLSGLGVSRTAIVRATGLSPSALYDVMQTQGQGADRPRVQSGRTRSGSRARRRAGEEDG